MPADAASTSACARATSTSRRSDLDDALALIEQHTAREARRCRSACSATPPRSLPELVRRAKAGGIRPDLVTDQTSAHDLDQRLPAARLDASSAGRPRRPTRRSTRALRRPPRRSRCAVHVQAMLDFQAMGVADRRLRQQHPPGRARTTASTNAFDFPGFVPAYIRPLFCDGKGPFRWVALSGDPEDIRKTDAKMKELFPDDAHLHRWLDMARERIAFQGLPARICWLGLGERASRRPGLQRDGARRGELKAPIVIGRDHLDTGSVASARTARPRAMQDGTDAVSDWPLLNALLNTAGGATWVIAPPRRRRRHGLFAARRRRDRLRRHRRGGRSASSACCGTTRRPA